MDQHRSKCSVFDLTGIHHITSLRPQLTPVVWHLDCRDLVPLGGQRGGFNFNLDDKRVVNMVSEVKDEDNIKQDMSIDVYGRKDKEEQAVSV